MPPLTTSTLPAVMPTSAWASSPPPEAVRITRGFYLLPVADPPVWKQRREMTLARLAAVVDRYPSTIALSHESAALLHGAVLRSHEPDIHTIQTTHQHRSTVVMPDVIYGGKRTRSAPRSGTRLTSNEVDSGPVRLHRRLQTSLDDVSVTHIAGLPVTDISSTLLDCLLDLRPIDALAIGDSLARIMVDAQRFHEEEATQRWNIRRAELDERLRRLARRPGKARARRLLRLLNPLAESWGESELRFILLTAGFPEPVLQKQIEADGRFYFIDIALPGLMLAIEFDGKMKYDGENADVLYGEKKRQDALHRAGWDVMRVRSEELRRPEQIVANLLQRLPHDHKLRLRPCRWLGSLPTAQ